MQVKDTIVCGEDEGENAIVNMSLVARGRRSVFRKPVRKAVEADQVFDGGAGAHDVEAVALDENLRHQQP